MYKYISLNLVHTTDTAQKKRRKLYLSFRTFALLSGPLDRDNKVCALALCAISSPHFCTAYLPLAYLLS